jgi:hypothetical protein
MRIKHPILFILLILPVVLIANDSIVGKFVKTWRILDRFATVDSIAADTAHLNFQNDNHIDKLSIANSFRGNLGSPIQSKLYFNRPQQHDFIFADAYFPYIKQIESATFYNTNRPFSSLYYLTGGTNYYEDEQIRFLFTANANKKLNFGTTLDYIFARGEYQNLSTKRFAGSLFMTYDGKKYKATAHASSNNQSNYDNGGIADTMYINGTVSYPSINIPVNINGYSNYRHNQLFYNHQYNIGIDRPIRINEDSVRFEYVPVTIFAHTFQLDDMRKRYYESAVEKDFYENTYLPDDFTNDTASLFMLTNRVSVSMAEEFNKWMKFGLTAYVENDVRKYGYLVDRTLTHLNESNTRIGGILSKNQGELLRYNVTGEFVFLGPKIGDFRLNGNLGSFFSLLKQKISLNARGFVKSQEPSHFIEYYQSNHFRWQNNFDKTYTTHLGGTFAIPTLGFKFDLSVENLSNYLFFNDKALPEQFAGNIQVVGADLKQDFHLGRFTLENNIVYQLSSHQDKLPLPDITLYHNLYYHDVWFKVLSMQVGVDMRYHSAYYAPSYMPATGQFHVQKDWMTGNYPVMNVYLNAHLKRTRFFVQYYHVNQLFMKGDYYSMPLYPIYPATLKMGLTWNFYD